MFGVIVVLKVEQSPRPQVAWTLKQVFFKLSLYLAKFLLFSIWTMSPCPWCQDAPTWHDYAILPTGSPISAEDVWISVGFMVTSMIWIPLAQLELNSKQIPVPNCWCQCAARSTLQHTVIWDKITERERPPPPFHEKDVSSKALEMVLQAWPEDYREFLGHHGLFFAMLCSRFLDTSQTISKQKRCFQRQSSENICKSFSVFDMNWQFSVLKIKSTTR